MLILNGSSGSSTPTQQLQNEMAERWKTEKHTHSQKRSEDSLKMIKAWKSTSAGNTHMHTLMHGHVRARTRAHTHTTHTHYKSAVAFRSDSMGDSSRL